MSRTNQKYLAEAKQILASQGIVVDEATLKKYTLSIVSAYSDLPSCKSCDRDYRKVTSCFRPNVIYDEATKDLRIEFTPCPYAADAKKRHRYGHELEEMLLSSRFRSRSFGNFVPSAQSQKLVAFLQEWVASYHDKCRGFYIFGGIGAGKTHLAVAAMLSVYKIYHAGCMYMVVPKFLDELKASFHDGDRMSKRFELYSKAPVLLIDDLGAGRKESGGSLSSWAKEKLFTLINERYENELTTLVTSVYNPRDISSVIGDATVSRLVEMCYFLHIKDGDHRFSKFKVIE